MSQRKSAKGRTNHHRHLRERWKAQAARRKTLIAQQQQAIADRSFRALIMSEIFTVPVDQPKPWPSATAQNAARPA